MDRYFKLNFVAEEERLDVVTVAHEDWALNWFHWWEEQVHSPSWELFKDVVIKRFEPELVQNKDGPLLSIKQTRTVMEYRDRFEMVSALLRGGDQRMLRSIFLNGLKEELQAEFKLYPSSSLSELMDRALLLEEKNQTMTEEGGVAFPERGRGQEAVYNSRTRTVGEVKGSGPERVRKFKHYQLLLVEGVE